MANRWLKMLSTRNSLTVVLPVETVRFLFGRAIVSWEPGVDQPFKASKGVIVNELVAVREQVRENRSEEEMWYEVLRSFCEHADGDELWYYILDSKDET